VQVLKKKNCDMDGEITLPFTEFLLACVERARHFSKRSGENCLMTIPRCDGLSLENGTFDVLTLRFAIRGVVKGFSGRATPLVI